MASSRTMLCTLCRVPGVYLTWATSLFLAFFTFNGINNLRVFNVASSSIPTRQRERSQSLRS